MRWRRRKEEDTFEMGGRRTKYEARNKRDEQEKKSKEEKSGKKRGSDHQRIYIVEHR